MTTIEAPTAAAALLTPEAVRDRCAMIWRAGLGGTLAHFAVVPDRLDGVADYVVDTIRANYPDLDIPYHARWRHLTLDGTDLWRAALAPLRPGSPERARARFDLAVTSVLLDAGADADARNNKREQAIHIAELSNNVRIVDVLRKHDEGKGLLRFF